MNVVFINLFLVLQIKMPIIDNVIFLIMKYSIFKSDYFKNLLSSFLYCINCDYEQYTINFSFANHNISFDMINMIKKYHIIYLRLFN